MTARSLIVLLLLTGMARAQAPEGPDAGDEPPPQAATEAPPQVYAPAPPIYAPAPSAAPVYAPAPPPMYAPAPPVYAVAPAVQPRKRHRGDPVVAFGVVPGYRRYLGSDWIGTSLDFSFGGRAPNGFAVMMRLGLFTGASAFRVPFQHWTGGVVFVIPTGTRLSVELGQTIGLLVIEESRTSDGYALSPSLGGFLAPTVDLWHRGASRVYAELRLSCDWIPVEQDGDGTSLTAQLGLGVAF